MGKTLRTVLITVQVGLLIYGFVKEKPWKKSRKHLVTSSLNTLTSALLVRKRHQ